MTQRTNPMIHIILMAASILCLIPFWLVFVVSLTEEATLLRNGYSFWPQKFDFAAYQYLMQDATPILKAYGVSITVTVVGVVVSLAITSMLAYAISRTDFPLKKAITFYVFLTMLFSGGLLPWYLVYTRMLHVQDTLWALILPGLLSGFNVLIMRTFFMNSIPPSLIESAQIDGAGEFRTYFSMILPLSLPVMATIGLFVTISYWNEWFTSLVFINNPDLYSMQYLLNKTLLNIQFLARIASHAQGDIAAQPPLESIRMAMAIIAIGPMIVVFPFLQKYFVKGLTIGAVKG
ncbi:MULTISPECIES: carbohydrate ABC transporter permease [Paenibacillus]|uniref:carbohydrate ABC transporter permease n=1 Tax=Paenibacillus TaxID=44249 RepID=UPI0022B91ADA|nr:carbohydrate ABC transporter permease [Paenibacillus caseinilyticus]MCZ8518295.1 carbohydrate ABC transporter permease [Paenibacillus caseinilyticus]